MVFPKNILWFRMNAFWWRELDFLNYFYNKTQSSPQGNKVLNCFNLRPSKSLLFVSCPNYFG